ncbi:MAG: hypothetical protein KDD04_09525 [Sinomicrobium sp.]|nr:hypothetical protein [Sinomicrobium sp.]
MQKVDALIKRLQYAEDNFESFALDEVQANSGPVLDINRLDQLYRGMDAKGQAITPDYTAVTKFIKRANGQPTDRVTLKDTGAYYDSFRLVVKKSDFEVVTTDRKTKKLEKKYGDDLRGIDRSNYPKLVEIIRPGMFTRFKKAVLP